MCKNIDICIYFIDKTLVNLESLYHIAVQILRSFCKYSFPGNKIFNRLVTAIHMHLVNPFGIDK